MSNITMFIRITRELFQLKTRLFITSLTQKIAQNDKSNGVNPSSSTVMTLIFPYQTKPVRYTVRSQEARTLRKNERR